MIQRRRSMGRLICKPGLWPLYSQLHVNCIRLTLHRVKPFDVGFSFPLLPVLLRPCADFRTIDYRLGITQHLIKSGIARLEEVRDANGALENLYVRVSCTTYSYPSWYPSMVKSGKVSLTIRSFFFRQLRFTSPKSPS